MLWNVRDAQRGVARVILPAGVGACLAAAVCLAPTFAQTQKSSTGSSSSTTTPATPNSSLPRGFQATPQFVIGKVVMDEGAIPAGGITIERMCGSTVHTEGHTDSNGGFGIELGHDEIVQDVSDGSGAVINPNRPAIPDDIAGDPNRPYRECELRANLPGYRSESVLLSTYRPGENTNIGTILLHRMANIEGGVISANTAAAPRPAAKEYERGLDLVKKGKTDDAVQSFNKAVEFYPRFAAAWFELGKLQLGLQQTLDAQKSFEAALKAEPKFVSPYLELSTIAFRLKNWPALADITSRLLRLDAVDFPREHYYNGLANYTLQRMEPAEASLRETIKLDTQNRYPRAHQFLAAILVKNNDLAAAAEQLRSYLQLSPTPPDADTARRQLAELEKITRASAR